MQNPSAVKSMQSPVRYVHIVWKSDKDIYFLCANLLNLMYSKLSESAQNSAI